MFRHVLPEPSANSSVGGAGLPVRVFAIPSREMAFDVRSLFAVLGGWGCILALGKWCFVHSFSITVFLFVVKLQTVPNRS